MAEIHTTGKEGENLAVEFLKAKGYKILATNWHFGKMEIDIVAQDNDFIVFVEVKTRHSTLYGEPENAVNRDKQRFLVRAAQAFIEIKKIEWEARFDIISVIFSSTGHNINHIPNAFYPTLQ
jgi:putative endonuclease